MGDIPRKRGGFIWFIEGCSEISVPKDNAIELLNLLLETGIYYRNLNISCEEEGRAVLEVTYMSSKRLLELCSMRGIDAETKLLFGTPMLLEALWKRKGIVIGLILAALILFLGCNVLWQVEVSGNDSLDDGKVREILALYGVRPGAWLSGIDIDSVRTAVEHDVAEIAWIAVNVKGTVAYVELIEAVNPQAPQKSEGDGANLVASFDGVIVGSSIIAGESVVSPGQTVQKGELLVSGLLDSSRLGWRAVVSEGSVFASVSRDFSVTVPYEYIEKTVVGSEICEISLIFFSFEQKIFKKGGFNEAFCDTINSVKYIYSSEERTVPVGIAQKRLLKVNETIKTRTLEEARDLAFFEVNRQMGEELRDAEILRRVTYGGECEDGSGYVLTCRVICVIDIAEPVPFYINDTGEQEGN